MRQVFNVLPYFSPVESEKIIEVYKKYGTIRKVKKGSVLKQGGESNKLFLLKSGLCVYFVNYLLEKPRALSLILPNRTMGDITCVTGDVVNVTSVAIRDSEVYVVPPEILLQYMKNDFDINMEVVKKVIFKEECYIESMLANFTLEHEDRLKVFYKTMLVSINLDINNEWAEIPLKLSNEEIGMLIHATRVTVNRIQSKWQTEGVYKRVDNKRYINMQLFNDIYDWHDYKS